MLNVSGSTDVLCLCTNHPRPHEKLLTRALGIGRAWLSVGTLAAAGSAVTWAHDQFFRDLSQADYFKLVNKLAGKSKVDPQTAVVFEPYLAGERTSIEQKTGSFSNLKLATTREDMLQAVLDSLAKASGARLELLKSQSVKINPTVFVSGGTAKALHRVLHRDWPGGHWRFKSENEASLRGLSRIHVS